MGTRSDPGKLPVWGRAFPHRPGRADRELPLLEVPEGERSGLRRGRDVASRDCHLLAGDGRVRGYESSPGAQRRFCRVCGWRVPSPLSDGRRVFVPAGLLDDDPGMRPACHEFVGSRAPWWEIADDLPQFEGWGPSDGSDESGEERTAKAKGSR